MRFSAHSYLFHFSLFISTRVFKFNIEHLRDTKKANRQFTISKKSLNRNCAANQFIYFKRARKTKTETMCQIKILINVEQNLYGSIITSMLCSKCWVFTEHLEHPENTPMTASHDSLPHWPEEYAKYYTFLALLRPIFALKTKIPPLALAMRVGQGSDVKKIFFLEIT